MVRLDEQTWMKCGIEFVDGIQHVSAVVTREFSDGSVVRLAHTPPTIWLHVVREGPAVTVAYARDGGTYTLLRLAYLTPAETVQVGPMCAAPDGAGFPGMFEEFSRIHPAATAG